MPEIYPCPSGPLTIRSLAFACRCHMNTQHPLLSTSSLLFLTPQVLQRVHREAVSRQAGVLFLGRRGVVGGGW